MNPISLDQQKEVSGGITPLEGAIRFVNQMTISFQVYQETRDEKNKEGNLGLE